nr:MAG TPA: hypothetical protein [Caudoviricetes sp.]
MQHAEPIYIISTLVICKDITNRQSQRREYYRRFLSP